MPSRLTKRLAILVAMISRRSRCARIASPCRSCMICGKASHNSCVSVGSSASEPASIAACSAIFAVDSRTASSGRVRPRSSWPRRSSSSLVSSPSTARLSRPLSSRISITRTSGGSACAPPRSAIDSASVCRRLSSSTSAATSSVISASNALRSSNVSRPSAISRLSGILMLTSLSEQSTPALLSMKSVLIRPPPSENSMRAAWVMARLAPSPIALTRSSAALTRIASLPGSPTSTWFCVLAFT